MADLHSPHDNVDVKINSKINFYGPVILSVTAPFMLLVLIFFALWAITSWSHVGMVAAIVVYGGLGIVGIGMLVGIVGIGVRWVAIPLIHSMERFIEAKGQHNRNKLIHIQDNAAVIENEKGHVQVIPLQTMQQRDIYHHKPELPQVAESKEDESSIPSEVSYDTIKYSIPRGHALIGVGDGGRIVSSQNSIRALTWIVGSSGAGKTNSVVLRMQDMYDLKHQFLVIDPHYYKEDSLARAIEPYSDRFLRPIAYTQQDILAMLNAFLDMGRHRLNTPPPYTPITMVIDEVGSQSAVVDKEDALRVEIKDKIKEVGRFCGQEGRGFEMRAIMISQNGTYLAWLRQNASLAIVHQIQDWNSRITATNNNSTIARDMDTWPKGRTYCYGIDFDPVVVQQPLVARQRNALTLNANMNDDEMEPLPLKFSNRKRPEGNGEERGREKSMHYSSNLSNGKTWEGNGEERGRSFSPISQENILSTKNILRDLGRRLKNGEDRATILRSLEASSGRANQEIGAVLDALIEEE